MYLIVVMFQGSLSIEKLASLLKKSKDQVPTTVPLKKLERVVFIDSTWSQSYGIRTVRNLMQLMKQLAAAFYLSPLKFSTAIYVILCVCNLKML